MHGGEVFPLQQHIGQLLVHRSDELVDERVIVVVVDASVAPTQILGVVQQFDVVGAHVEHDRKSASGIYAADESVERQLADRDAHAADALVAQAQYPLPVRHHDHVDIAVRPVANHLVKTVAVRIGHEQSPWPPVDLAETLAGLTDGGGVDNRQGFGDVLAQQPVEQRLVAVLQRAQVDVLVEIVAASGELMPAMFDLLGEGLHHGRQQAQQAQPAAFVRGEGSALGRQRIEQSGLSPVFVRHRRILTRPQEFRASSQKTSAGWAAESPDRPAPSSSTELR